MMSCPKCGCGLQLVAADGATIAPKTTPQGGDKVEVDAAGFRNLCMLIKQKPEAASFAEAMDSLPRGLEKYGSLTAGQWRLFKAAHHKALGTWPPEPQEIKAEAFGEQPLPEDDVSIPF